MSLILVFVVVFLISFFFGSIPWGVIISKIMINKDIRTIGSGNTGATNALRAMGKQGGLIVFLLDFFKGVVAAFLSGYIYSLCAQLIGVDPDLMRVVSAFSVLSCILGHIFSPWLNFKGGKGVSVAFGSVFFTLGIPATLAAFAVFVVVVLLTRYVSLGSIIASLAAIALGIFLYGTETAFVIIHTLSFLIIISAHHENIARLIKGEENKLSFSKKNKSKNA